jgi:hypothetical protein
LSWILKETGHESVDCITLVQGTIMVDACETVWSFCVPQRAEPPERVLICHGVVALVN